MNRRQQTQAGVALIEVIVAMSILLLFLTALAGPMIKAQFTNRQNAYRNGSSTIINYLSDQFTEERGKYYAEVSSGSAPAAKTCDEYLSGTSPQVLGGGSAVMLGGNSGIVSEAFTSINETDEQGFNNKELYQVTVKRRVLSLGTELGKHRSYQISVFYPNPTDPNGQKLCYSTRILGGQEI